MQLTDKHREYWHRNLVITTILMVVWFIATFVEGWYARDLNNVTFFGFPVAPAALADHWVVLEEPPSGYRFYTEKHGLPLAVGAHAADYAMNRFAPPVRVLIGALLKSA